MPRLPVTKSEGSLGKKTSQSSLLCLLIYFHSMFRHMPACLDVISGHIKEKLITGNHQDAFTEVKSCLTNMIAFCHKITGFVDERSLLVSLTLILGILKHLSHSTFVPNLMQVIAWVGKLLADKKSPNISINRLKQQLLMVHNLPMVTK